MKPMLCSPMRPKEAEKLGHGWVIERKYDGIRAYIQGGKLYDRRGKDITAKFPEFEGLAQGVSDVLDGEIVCGESFGDVSGRVHLKDAFAIRLNAKRRPATFVVFDAVEPGYMNTRRMTIERYKDRFPWLKIAEQEALDSEGEVFLRWWERVQENGWEGVVVKNPSSGYEEGTRSENWKKVKAFEETTAVFVKLDEHPKGVRLETADGRSVNVNGAQAAEVRETFKKTGSVTGEVQYLPQSGSDAWRFPSWRGIIAA